MDGPALLDPHGCLTASGLDALKGASPGQAPTELAAHLAQCARCQRRLLSLGGPGALHAGKPRQTAPPPVWRTLVVVVAALLLLASVLVTLRWLTTTGD
jgi:hypothetical protein